MDKDLFSVTIAAVIVMLATIPIGPGLKPIVQAQSVGSEWNMTVTGLVEHELNLSLTELATMPKTTVNAALICVGSPGSVVAEGDWVGVKLWFLLEKVGVSSEAVKVAFYAMDGFSTDLPVETAKREDIILAYEKDGAPLSEKLRLVVPGKWGYKWISQVTSIVLVNYDFKGVWESNGYPDAADIEGETVPEFSSVMFILISSFAATFFALTLGKRAKILKAR